VREKDQVCRHDSTVVTVEYSSFIHKQHAIFKTPNTTAQLIISMYQQHHLYAAYTMFQLTTNFRSNGGQIVVKTYDKMSQLKLQFLTQWPLPCDIQAVPGFQHGCECCTPLAPNHISCRQPSYAT